MKYRTYKPYSVLPVLVDAKLTDCIAEFKEFRDEVHIDIEDLHMLSEDMEPEMAETALQIIEEAGLAGCETVHFMA
jgi:hypothetical protein